MLVIEEVVPDSPSGEAAVMAVDGQLFFGRVRHG